MARRLAAPGSVKRAKALRKDMGASERYVWDCLRKLRSQFVFRRQVPLGPYVVDFYCAKARLVIELDSDFHNQGHDLVRDAYLRSLGLRIVRMRTESLFEQGTHWLDDAFQAVFEQTGVRLEWH